MILSAILGIFFWKDTNPFLEIEKKQKIISLLQISLIIAIISFISSFIRISYISYEFCGGLILTLIIVNSPLLLILLRRREDKVGYLIILISSFLIIGFVLHLFSLVFDPSYVAPLTKSFTIFPPLSYPLMPFHEVTTIHGVPGPLNDIYFFSTYKIGIIMPLFTIQFPTDTILIQNMAEYQRILEIIALRNQIFIFLLNFILNLTITLGTLKIYTKLEKKIDINKISAISCRTSILLANIFFTAYILAGFVAYSIYRFYGDISMENINLIGFVLIIIISVGLILRFYKYPLLQESYQRFTKELLVIGLIGLISLVIVLIIETIWPLPDLYLDYSSAIVMIIIGIIPILSTLFMMYKPIFSKQNAKLEEISTSS